MIALRIAHVLGLNPIYLIGIDLCPEDVGAENFNFHNDYDIQRQSKISDLKIERFRKYFVEAIDELVKRSVEVFSCSPRSSLNAHIPYVSLESIIEELENKI